MTEINPNTTAKIIFPPKGNSLSDEEKRQEILDTLQGITSSQIESIWEKMLKNAEQREAEQQKAEQKKTEQIKELYWDKEKILKNLKENYVKVEENVEMMWYKWKNVHINLPAVWEFKWFKFDYFVSNKIIYKKIFESNLELEKKSYSMKEIWGLLKAMNRYMKKMGVETDGDMDYENDLKFWGTRKFRCDAWDCFKKITWIDFWLWLKDKDVDWKKGSRASWNCRGDLCDFIWIGFDNYYANLFLRLS